MLFIRFVFVVVVLVLGFVPGTEVFSRAAGSGAPALLPSSQPIPSGTENLPLKPSQENVSAKDQDSEAQKNYGKDQRTDRLVIDKSLEFVGYMRAGVGWNSALGRQECFNNPGSRANEFRLGNECTVYGEASLRTHLIRAAGPDDPFFNIQTTLSYFPPADSQYEDTKSANTHDINLIEAFVVGGNFDGFPMIYWAGKRFYRNVDVHMGDFFYFANMSGTGAGVGHLNTGFGIFKAALIEETAQTDEAGGPTRIDTINSGPLSKSALDLQLEEVPLTAVDSLHLWAVLATSPGGVEAATGNRYVAGRGYVGGIRYHRLIGHGTNDFAAVYGTGIMEQLEMNAGTAVSANNPSLPLGNNQASRLRFVESLTVPLANHLSTHFESVYEDRKSGATVDGHSTWWDIGARPVYFFTEHYQLALEVGHSVVKDDSEHLGPRVLDRVTLAPQVAIASDIFARPVIRFYVTRSMWNDANKDPTHGMVATLPDYIDRNSATSFGVQTEVWF